MIPTFQVPVYCQTGPVATKCHSPGSSKGSYAFLPVLATCQSRMRPTKGEMSVTPASAQATAWAKEKSSVMLQWMPCCSSSSLWGGDRARERPTQRHAGQSCWTGQLTPWGRSGAHTRSSLAAGIFRPTLPNKDKGKRDTESHRARPQLTPAPRTLIPHILAGSMGQATTEDR